MLCAIAVVFFLGVSGASSLSSFTVLAGHDIGLPESASGLLTAGGGLIAAFMRVAAGKMAEKEDADPLRMTLFMLLGGALGYLTLFSVSQSKLLFCTGVVLAFAFGWGWNGLLNLAVVSQFYKRAANATGVSAVGARLGGVCGPFIFGLLTDRYSYQTSWLFPFGCCLIGAVVLMFVGQRRYS